MGGFPRHTFYGAHSMSTFHSDGLLETCSVICKQYPHNNEKSNVRYGWDIFLNSEIHSEESCSRCIIWIKNLLSFLPRFAISTYDSEKTLESWRLVSGICAGYHLLRWQHKIYKMYTLEKNCKMACSGFELMIIYMTWFTRILRANYSLNSPGTNFWTTIWTGSVAREILQFKISLYVIFFNIYIEFSVRFMTKLRICENRFKFFSADNWKTSEEIDQSNIK